MFLLDFCTVLISDRCTNIEREVWVTCFPEKSGSDDRLVGCRKSESCQRSTGTDGRRHCVNVPQDSWPFGQRYFRLRRETQVPPWPSLDLRWLKYQYALFNDYAWKQKRNQNNVKSTQWTNSVTNNSNSRENMWRWRVLVFFRAKRRKRTVLLMWYNCS